MSDFNSPEPSKMLPHSDEMSFNVIHSQASSRDRYMANRSSRSRGRQLSGCWVSALVQQFQFTARSARDEDKNFALYATIKEEFASLFPSSTDGAW